MVKVTANSRAAALGIPELSIRNYWCHQRWGGTDPQRQRSQNAHQRTAPKQFSLKSLTSQTSPNSCMSPKQTARLSAGRERGVSLGCNAGVGQSWSLHAGLFVCHTISQHPSVKDSFVPRQMMRYHSQQHRVVSLELKGPTGSCVWVLSTRHLTGTEKPCKMLHPGVHRTVSCTNPSGSRACSSHSYSEGQQCCLH